MKISYCSFKSDTTWELDTENIKTFMRNDGLKYGTTAMLGVVAFAILVHQPEAIHAFNYNVPCVQTTKVLADNAVVTFLRELFQRQVELEAMKVDAANTIMHSLFGI